MTMHLERGLTTTSTKKRKVKITKSQQEDFERGWKDRNICLKQMGLPKETFEQYMDFVHGKVKKETRQETHRKEPKTAVTASPLGRKQEVSGIARNNSAGNEIPESGRVWVTGPCASKPSPVYTGTKVVGIATMHKSNAVPIFSDEEAKEVSSMRR